MGLKTFPGGVHPHDSKEFSKDAAIEDLPIPKKVVIPLSQHIGAPAKPLVKVGDEVKTGQKIAEPGGFVSIPMHASISGKITKIADFPHPTGITSLAIEITGDGKDDWIELYEEDNFLELTADEIKNRISEAGICGMGGAGFPTLVKISPPTEKPIDTVILNGVECEPFLTADYRLMLEKADEIIWGLKLLMKTVDAQNGIIGIEANKPDVIKKMKELTATEQNIRVVGLKLKYPQGAEKQLIYAATKRKVPNKGGLPMDVNVVVQNVGTAFAVYEAVRYKKPLVERIVTVSGSIVKVPKNLKTRIGTKFEELLEFCNGTTEDIGKVISGGPMMGFAIPNLEAPVAKGSSGLLLFNKKQAHRQKENTCIRCGSCVDVCPMNLVPSLIAKNVRYEDWEMTEKYGVMDCIKCGSCAYVCPSNIKLIQWIDIGKMKISEKNRS
ncbi:MAG: H+/Na+-translocating ferredoxin:NAD+ oxidoreductase subunit [Candidatus Cloacimonadota bacterium]|nr:H+/Na+-translocating ferredoxin:NAD+ oxidoreductase subunit [Candidatus Cloacimonadota bacterium]